MDHRVSNVGNLVPDNLAKLRMPKIINDDDEEPLDPVSVYKDLPVDLKDYDIGPDYATFKFPYHNTCRNRYVNAREIYEAQFQREIDKLWNLATVCGDSVRLTQHLAYSTLWPPLHTRRELKHTQERFFRLTPEQRTRLYRIMRTKYT